MKSLSYTLVLREAKIGLCEDFITYQKIYLTTTLLMWLCLKQKS